MTHHSNGTPAHPLCPHRFSAQPEAMVDFLQTLGMTPRPAPEGRFSGVLAAGAGLIAVRGLSPGRPAETGAVSGETQLVFLAEDARHTAGRLQEDGLTSMWWDEDPGRRAGVTGPHGEGIWFTEDADHFGGREHLDDGPTSAVTLVAMRSCEVPEDDAAFFRHLGYEPVPGAAVEGWAPLAVPDAPSGILGLHAPGGGRPPAAVDLPPGGRNPAGRHAPVTLGFMTAEELSTLADRLTAAGHPVERAGGEAGALTVRDPDGRSVEVRRA